MIATMSRDRIKLKPGPSASTADTPDETVAALDRAKLDGRIERAIERATVPENTLVQDSRGTLYRTKGADSRTLVRVSAKFNKAERKQWKKSRRAMRALTAHLKASS